MHFYTALSTFYDEIFAVSQHEMDFIDTLIPPAARVLDVGCGTGNKTVLINNAARIDAIDLDAGMIDYARTHHARPHICYQQMDMRALAEKCSPGATGNLFDAVLCLGNTLVHLPEHEVGLFLRAAKDLLRNGGSCVIQILNYDRILDKHIQELPVIETEHAIFTRRYQWVDHTMHFQTSITVRGTGICLENDTILYPLRTKSLECILQAAGFHSISRYGTFSGCPWSKDSFVSLVHGLC